jgi:hypothetical protein
MPTESWVVDGPTTLELADVRTLRIGLVAGRADVVAHDGTGVRLEVHSVSGRPLEVTVRDGELRIGYAYTLGGWDGFLETLRNFRGKDSADLHVAVPAHLPVRLGSVSAEGLLAGVQEDASVSTVSGSMVTDGTRGSLSVKTVSGDVAVRSHTGNLSLTSVSGELTGSGELTVVQATTVSGDLALDTSASTSSVTISSVSGDVSLRLPAGKGLQIGAQSVSGRLVVDGQEYKGSTPGHRTVDLRTGDGSCHVTASTVSGDMTVLRGDAPAADAPVAEAPAADAPVADAPAE